MRYKINIKIINNKKHKLYSLYHFKNNDLKYKLYKYLKILSSIKNLFKKKEYKKRCELLIDGAYKGKERDFYSSAHEIRAADILYRIDNSVEISEDHNHTKNRKSNTDIYFKNRYRIECVTCSTGEDKLIIKELSDIDLAHLNKKVFHNNYNEPKKHINIRILNELDCKRKKYNDYHLNFEENDSYIIFINYGNIADLCYSFNYSEFLLEVLVGKDCPILYRNKKNEIKMAYKYQDKIKKSNGTYINTDLFFNDDYKCISAIMLANRNLMGVYNYNNVVLFLNPNAEKQIDVNDFKGIPYWKILKNHECIIHKNN